MYRRRVRRRRAQPLVRKKTKKSGYRWKNLVRQKQTNEQIWKALKASTMALELIKEEKLTQEMCDYVFKTEGCDITEVPEKFRTEEMVMKYVSCFKCGGYGGPSYYDIPDKVYTNEIRRYVIYSEIGNNIGIMIDYQYDNDGRYNDYDYIFPAIKNMQAREEIKFWTFWDMANSHPLTLGTVTSKPFKILKESKKKELYRRNWLCMTTRENINLSTLVFEPYNSKDITSIYYPMLVDSCLNIRWFMNKYPDKLTDTLLHFSLHRMKNTYDSYGFNNCLDDIIRKKRYDYKFMFDFISTNPTVGDGLKNNMLYSAEETLNMKNSFIHRNMLRLFYLKRKENHFCDGSKDELLYDSVLKILNFYPDTSYPLWLNYEIVRLFPKRYSFYRIKGSSNYLWRSQKSLDGKKTTKPQLPIEVRRLRNNKKGKITPAVAKKMTQKELSDELINNRKFYLFKYIKNPSKAVRKAICCSNTTLVNELCPLAKDEIKDILTLGGNSSSQFSRLPNKYKTYENFIQAIKLTSVSSAVFRYRLTFLKKLLDDYELQKKLVKENEDVLLSLEIIYNRYNKKIPYELFAIHATTSPKCFMLTLANDYESVGDDIIIPFLELDGTNLKYVPYEKIRKVHCNTAVKQNGLALFYVPKKYRSKGLEKRAFKSNPDCFKCLENPTDEQKWAAIRHNGKNIMYIENPTKEMWIEAVRNDYKMTRYINPEWIPKELEAKIVDSDPNLIRYINRPTDDMWISALRRNGMLLYFCTIQKEEYCIEALKNDPKSVIYINSFTPNTFEFLSTQTPYAHIYLR